MALVVLLVLGQFGSGLFPESPATEGDIALQEETQRLLEQPIDLNRASAEDLLTIPWLNPFLAHQIVALRDSAGRIESVEQLRAVPGMTREAFESIRPFLRTGTRPMPWAGGVVARAATDSVPAGAERVRLFNRLGFQVRPVRATALTEKDRGESSAFDFVSAGAEVRVGQVRLMLGEFTAGAGQGLVLSAPYWRSSLLNGRDRAGQTARLASSANEGSYLRGGAAEATFGNWDLCLLGSYAGRDARLNQDGTIERLTGAGIHDDSEAIAGRNAVHEASAGLSAARRTGRVGVGIAAEYSRYSRSFAPVDRGSSFSGDRLAAGAVSTGLDFGRTELGLELAYSSGGGVAGVLDVQGDWQDFDARASLRGRQHDFYAPHGRWTSLTGTDDRLDASGRLAWHHAGTGVSVSGNTYRDFELDSMPAKLDLRLAQELGRLDLALVLGTRSKAEEQRFRTARVEVGAGLGPRARARLTLADVYPEKSESRGLMLALSVAHEIGPVELELTGARFGITGPGITMYLSEPGAGRIGSSYSASASAWRVSTGLGFTLGRWLRIGAKAGYELKQNQPAVIDLAGQVELQKP